MELNNDISINNGRMHKPHSFDEIRFPLQIWYLLLDKSTRDKLAPLAALLLSNSGFPVFQRTKLDLPGSTDLMKTPSADQL